MDKIALAIEHVKKLHGQKKGVDYIFNAVLRKYDIAVTRDAIRSIIKHDTPYHSDNIKSPTKSVDNKRMDNLEKHINIINNTIGNLNMMIQGLSNESLNKILALEQKHKEDSERLDNLKKTADLAINKAGEAMNKTMNVAKSVADLAIDNANKHFEIAKEIKTIKDDITELRATSKELIKWVGDIIDEKVNTPIAAKSTKSKERWKPKEGNVYFTYHLHLKDVYSYYWKGIDNDIDAFSMGDVFKTAIEARAWGEKWVKRMQEEAGNE